MGDPGGGAESAAAPRTYVLDEYVLDKGLAYDQLPPKIQSRVSREDYRKHARR